MKLSLKRLWKFRASLGPVEQAQVVASTAVVVAMVTIVFIRVFSGYQLDWYDFVSVTTVGLFGFLIVFFTLKYGRLLEEQKQELLALKTLAEAVNRAVEVDYLLQNALREISNLLDVEHAWIYRVEGGRLVMKASQRIGGEDYALLRPETEITEAVREMFRTPRIQRKPRKATEAFRTGWPHPDVEAWASVPIMMKNSFEGVIIVATEERVAFGRKQLELMSGFANQIGVALENAALIARHRESEERYMDLFEHSPDMYHIVNRDGIIVSCNQTEADRLGYRKEELVGQPVQMLYPYGYRAEAQRILQELFESKREITGHEEQMVTKNGELIDVSISTSFLVDDAGEPVLIRTAARDITEKKRLEEKILHAQKIDSIGNLAGGVAHDFNNILTSILGSTAIMKRRLKKTDDRFRLVDIVETAAKRGASLTRQLLTFARKSNVRFRPLLLNDIIGETLQLFERSVDKTISITTELTDEPCIVNGDDGQIQQALLNLLINARDSMPEGGTIVVREEIVDFSERKEREMGEAKAGKYVSVSIRDTGVGMDRATQQRIFEPFFTTKEQGKGTGLGLSVVYGVVNSHNGFITVWSEPGEGSEFRMYFPILSDIENLTRRSRRARLPRGNEHILVVDDEESVGEVIAGMLKDLGYKVTVVNNGQRAVTLYQKKKRFDAVVLDINMPEMSGRDTLLKLKEIDPQVRVVVSTGYGTRSAESLPLHESIDGFLEKPYQLEALSKTLRSVLDKDHSA